MSLKAQFDHIQILLRLVVCFMWQSLAKLAGINMPLQNWRLELVFLVKALEVGSLPSDSLFCFCDRWPRHVWLQSSSRVRGHDLHEGSMLGSVSQNLQQHRAPAAAHGPRLESCFRIRICAWSRGNKTRGIFFAGRQSIKPSLSPAMIVRHRLHLDYRFRRACGCAVLSLLVGNCFPDLSEVDLIRVDSL